MTIRVVHGVKNKMDNGCKKFSKKVVRRAVRRAGKKAIKLSVPVPHASQT